MGREEEKWGWEESSPPPRPAAPAWLPVSDKAIEMMRGEERRGEEKLTALYF